MSDVNESVDQVTMALRGASKHQVNCSETLVEILTKAEQKRVICVHLGRAGDEGRQGRSN